MESVTIPGHDQFIVDAIQLHMLQAPSFVDALRNIPFTPPGKVGSVEHADLDAVRAELGDQGSKQRGT